MREQRGQDSSIAVTDKVDIRIWTVDGIHKPNEVSNIGSTSNIFEIIAVSLDEYIVEPDQEAVDYGSVA